VADAHWDRRANCFDERHERLALDAALERTAYTTFIKESADFATGLATPSGEFFAYPRDLGVSSFVGLDMSTAITAAGPLAPGDVVITNDPYGTRGLATHLPDVHFFRPLFAGDKLICYAWAFINVSDIGGLVPASISPRAFDIQQEGLRIPPRKLYQSGQLDEALLELILANTRTPEHNWGDFQAMIAALGTAERRVSELIDRFGLAGVRAGMAMMLDWSERRARATVESIPDGDYSFADYLDDDTSGTPVRLAVTLRVRGDTVVADYSGTDPQVDAAFNLPAYGPRHPFLLQGLINFTLSEDPSIPLTGGLVRPFSVVAPEGTILNPRYPAAVGVRYATVIRLYNVVLGALAQAVPDRVPAAGAGQAAMVMMSVADPFSGARSVTVIEPLNGGGGATAGADGVAANDSACGYLRNTPVESVEEHTSVLIERYELLPGSCGHGRYRGGWGVCLQFRALAPKTIVTARGMERCRFEPWGRSGGGAAGRTQAYLARHGNGFVELSRAIDVLHLEPGDSIRLEATGGGGYGWPGDRPPELVLADVRSGLLSPSVALETYGVVLTQESAGGFDDAATRGHRQKLGAGPEELFDLGLARRGYERTWPPGEADLVVRELQRVPEGLRGWAWRLLHERARQRQLPPLKAWGELCEELNARGVLTLAEKERGD
jgi:N-methylhydantoinase B